MHSKILFDLKFQELLSIKNLFHFIRDHLNPKLKYILITKEYYLETYHISFIIFKNCICINEENDSQYNIKVYHKHGPMFIIQIGDIRF